LLFLVRTGFKASENRIHGPP